MTEFQVFHTSNNISVMHFLKKKYNQYFYTYLFLYLFILLIKFCEGLLVSITNSDAAIGNICMEHENTLENLNYIFLYTFSLFFLYQIPIKSLFGACPAKKSWIKSSRSALEQFLDVNSEKKYKAFSSPGNFLLTWNLWV